MATSSAMPWRSHLGCKMVCDMLSRRKLRTFPDSRAPTEMANCNAKLCKLLDFSFCGCGASGRYLICGVFIASFSLWVWNWRNPRLKLEKALRTIGIHWVSGCLYFEIWDIWVDILRFKMKYSRINADSWIGSVWIHLICLGWRKLGLKQFTQLFTNVYQVYSYCSTLICSNYSKQLSYL